MTHSHRHHYLPVFLLSGFQIPGGRQVPRMRVLRADRVFEAGVTDVGVETDFHSESGFYRDPEGMLSKWEGEFATEIKRWTVGPLDHAGRALADKLVAHLRLRSRTLRRLGAQLMESLLRVAEGGLSQVVTANQPDTSLREELGAMLDAATRQARAGTWTEQTREQWLDHAARDAVARHVAHWSVLEAAGLTRSILSDGFGSEMVTAVHTMMMLTALINYRKFEAFGDFRWEVAGVTGDTLLLGDVGPLCRYHGQSRLKPLYAASSPLDAVYLPIAPDRVLIGWHRKRPESPDSTTLSRATLELSHEFVVGTWASERLSAERGNLAARAKEDSPEAILGLEVPSDAPFITEIARVLSESVSRRVVENWAGTKSQRVPDRPALAAGNSAAAPPGASGRLIA